MNEEMRARMFERQMEIDRLSWEARASVKFREEQERDRRPARAPQGRRRMGEVRGILGLS
jgi:hypothetical protein